MPASLVEIPLEKLREFMDRDGWRVVVGSFIEFEGHHNDSEIRVVLDRGS
jgi:hypothetical protein